MICHISRSLTTVETGLFLFFIIKLINRIIHTFNVFEQQNIPKKY